MQVGGRQGRRNDSANNGADGARRTRSTRWPVRPRCFSLSEMSSYITGQTIPRRRRQPMRGRWLGYHSPGHRRILPRSDFLTRLSTKSETAGRRWTVAPVDVAVAPLRPDRS